jgi:hypothetical protein
MMLDEIERFVGQLREHPWLEADWIAAIGQGLRTSVRDPNPTLWDKLRYVIGDDDDEQAWLAIALLA